MNRENMEKWINALEAYDKEPARGSLLVQEGVDGEVKMCALGIGMDAMLPGSLVTVHKAAAIHSFLAWLGIEQRHVQINLKDDGSGYNNVTFANDNGLQSPWTIAQRLRETYLKEEGQ